MCIFCSCLSLNHNNLRRHTAEYLDDLGCTKMQMRKIRRALIAAGAPIKEDDNDASAPAASPAVMAAASNPSNSPAFGMAAGHDKNGLNR